MNQNILIIDGHPVYGPKMEGFFRGLTFKNVRLAATGKQALAVVRHQAPDLVLLSSFLQDADSLDVCRQVHELAGGATKIIVQIGLFTAPDTVSRFKECGADAVLMRKEKDLQPLQNAIESLLFQIK